MFIPIKGFRVHIRTIVWMIWKNFQIVTRSHLSRAFAILLGCLVTIREWDRLSRLSLSQPPTKSDALILVVTLLTLGAALWEIRGNKLSTSPQEVRFVGSIRKLLIELEKFKSDMAKEEIPVNALDRFIDDFLEASCHALCGKTTIDAGLMLPSEDGKALELVYRSKRAKESYPKRLVIQIPTLLTSPIGSDIHTTTEGEDGTGPAGVCYYQTRIVHMPSKNWQLSWPVKLTTEGNEEYQTLNPYEGWIVGEPPDREGFRSVLCVPVTMHLDARRSQVFGVLNFSTTSFDPFVSRDYMMAECFASILGQAISTARKRKSEARQEQAAKQATSLGSEAVLKTFVNRWIRLLFSAVTSA